MIAIFSRALLATINKASVPRDQGPILHQGPDGHHIPETSLVDRGHVTWTLGPDWPEVTRVLTMADNNAVMIRGLSGHSLLWLRCLDHWCLRIPPNNSLCAVSPGWPVSLSSQSYLWLISTDLSLHCYGWVYADYIVCEAKFVTLSLMPCVE